MLSYLCRYGRLAASRLYRALSADEKIQIPEFDRAGDGKVVSNVSAWMSYIMDFRRSIYRIPRKETSKAAKVVGTDFSHWEKEIKQEQLRNAPERAIYD